MESVIRGMAIYIFLWLVFRISGKRTLVPVVRAGGSDADAVLTAARARVLDIVDRIDRGEFPPKPHDLHICTYCAYPSVCRKDYVGDE